MDPTSLIPIADAMPVNWGIMLFLLVVTTFLHLVAMNVMFGGGVVGLAAVVMKGEAARPVTQSVAQILVYSTALTVNMGVAPLLFLQALYGQFFYASTVLMAVYWLSVVFLLIVTYSSIYTYKLRYSSGDGGLLFLLIPVLAMIVISFFFCNNISLMQMPESWLHYFKSRGGWLLNFDDSALIPRYLHFVLSAVALGGLTVAVLFERKKRKGCENSDQWIQYGCDWFTWATVGNFGAGFWFLGTLPKSVVGNAAPYSGLFVFFVIVSVITIVPALIAAYKRHVYKAVSWTLGTVFVMTIAREIARISYLKPYVDLSELPVKSQYSPFVVFVVVAVAVFMLLGWMFRQVRSEMEVR